MAAVDLLGTALDVYRDRFAIAVSFQKEGLVLLDMAWRLAGSVQAFTLDTGRLPVETLQMIDVVRDRYGIAVESVRPDPDEVARMVAERGPDLFRDSVELRHLCCEVRKVRPLGRKLQQLDAWATGLRREHSSNRAAIPKVAQEAGRIKISPLADWTAAQVDAYTEQHNVPVHPLYAHGFLSIGCEPCTRALLPGESGRAGRWWWEQDSRKECGIHFAPDGSARRAFAGGQGILTDTDA